MKSLNLFSAPRKSFRARVFLFFIVFFAAISFSFAVFFMRYQINSMKNDFINDGELLALVLAQNARIGIGIFSENKDVLQGLAEVVFQNAEAMSVSIWNEEGKLLRWAWRGKEARGKDFREGGAAVWGKEFQRLRETKTPFKIEKEDVFQFFSPINSRQIHPHNDYAAVGRSPDPSLLGFVEITMDKKGIHEKTRELLAWAAGIAMPLFLLGSWAAFLLAGKTAEPLKRLTEEVKALGRGVSVKEVPVETGDEIGGLALAFNEMSQALEKREAEKKVLEERLRHSQKMEAIGALTGGISHDFNNILQAIMFNIKTLRESMGMEGMEAELADDIIESAMSARNLIRSLLAFSHKQVMDKRPIDINTVVSRAARLMAPLVRGGIKLDVRLEKVPMIVLLDSGQMEQVLMNLVSNAKDAMSDGGTIAITTQSMELDPEFFKGCAGPEMEMPSGGYALLSFKDTGQGMDKKIMDKVFDPFFTTKEAGKGTGLGLSMVHGIVQQHKGFIDIQSERGQGTAFNIYLPLMKEKAAAKQEAGGPAPLLGGAEGILLAEDDEKVRKVFGEILKKYGYKVMEAKDGEDAVKKFMEEGGNIHLLLFDLMMPGQSGKDAYDMIKRWQPGIKALFISGYGEKYRREAGFVPCGVPVLSKPVNPEELLAKIREALEEK